MNVFGWIGVFSLYCIVVLQGFLLREYYKSRQFDRRRWMLFANLLLDRAEKLKARNLLGEAIAVHGVANDALRIVKTYGGAPELAASSPAADMGSPH